MMRNNKIEISNEEGANVMELRAKIGRNDLCYCGSGKKYKNCCLKKDQEEERMEQLFEQAEAVSDKYFSVKEYIELSGYPVVRFDFFLLEILNITGSTLYRYNKTSSSKNKSIIRKLYSYSKGFYKECLTCKNKCIKMPLKRIDFKSLIDKGLDIEELPKGLQERTAMNFFYIEFINGFAFELQEELSGQLDEETTYEIASLVYETLINYVADNCTRQCNNECIIEHDKNGYCKFCTFGSKKLPCPERKEISYETIKASETDMEHEY
ncbi:YecA family protein [Clostridium oryzae]|uniref:SEC-C motif protein n=1 Tax=Clostridium oryzae TaxID=1450648 RepID=A0A1V4IRM0_9CLOT|nr:SEC-C metal-binding domain-containing protein [Clostridium oryzae]OPJ62553.1 hypothetical protein CLORY_16830 [Clostridium oryzae]